jgi:GH15 family glucan-1,4-alpha-glucosidase
VSREIVLGNGKLAVLLDDKMRVRDLFFPRVGLENHLLGHEFKIGVWVNGKFIWLGDNWETAMQYLPETLVSKCLAKNRELEIELESNDAVHHLYNLYLRKITVHNLSDKKRQVRLLFSHDFHIYGVDAGDTALYEPSLSSIIHYKRKRYFLINGRTDHNTGIYQFAVGYKESPGREGTWRDAEDGILQGNPIAQGSVDSVISFKLEVPPESTGTVYYWIACGQNLEQVRDLDAKVKDLGVEQLLIETENYWSAWLNKQYVDLSVLPRDIIRMFKTSLLIMRTHVDNDGAVIASCDSDVLQFNRDTYSYVWPRDGAFASLAFDMAGYQEVSRLFFEFCSQVITERGFFHHKYSPDGSPGSSWHAWVDSKGQPQLPIQEDETALVLYALWRHFQKYRDLEFIGKVYSDLVVKTADFLLNHRDEKTGLPKPSFDIWEEKIGIFTSTVATVCSALKAAADFAKVFYDSKRQEMLSTAALQMKEAMLTHLYDRRLKRFVKAIYADGSRDPTVDSSLALISLCGPFNPGDEVVVNTMNALTDRLWVRTDIGGMARYENDEYYRVSKNVPGNPWFVCTLWLARWHIAKATSIMELKKGLDLLSWTTKHSLRSGILGEQVNPYTGATISVSPLIWSHAEFIIAVCQYLEKYQRISSVTKE